jgi:hypothetical protein
MTAPSASSLVITLGAASTAPAVSLPLTADSCWANLLGRWPLPATGTIDTLASAIDWLASPPAEVSLRGCPSACLLPILWLRTIWLAPDAMIKIDWQTIEDPSDQPGRQAAGRLACVLASQVRCADPARAASLWGFRSRPAGSECTDTEAFDLLNNLIDLWGLGPRHASPAAGWAQAARRALLACSSQGVKRIALYGAGTHTRALGDVLMETDVEITAIIDDDARRHGTRLWGFPIISPDDPLTMNLDAIMLSANSVEDLLWERTARHRSAGIHVIRLYGEQPITSARSFSARPGV